jgi:hypothetical protein
MTTLYNGYIFLYGGFCLLLVDVLLYPLFLPKVITSDSADSLLLTGCGFYIFLILGLILISFGLLKVFKSFADCKGLKQILGICLKDNSNCCAFWIFALSYGIFFCLVSGIVLYRHDSLSQEFGVDIPSTQFISYGPIGYTPVLTAYLTEHFGLLIIPLNLFVAISVSSLVGLNGTLSLAAFRGLRSSSSALPFIGATSGVFAACPTCASSYLLSLIGSSGVTGIAAFLSTYYILFLLISFPALIVGTILSLVTLKKIGVSKCISTK